ncbi:MAG TPA: MEDS domain-containing protein [Anaeromyxobacter sp.]
MSTRPAQPPEGEAVPGGGLGAGAGLRETGIDAVGDAPWGTHFCQLYETKDDLADVLVPYFKAGLEADEFCMWVTSPPLGVDEAWQALARAVPDLDAYRSRGRIEILPHTEWYLRGGKFEQDRVLDGWIAKLEAALARGCAGLRLTGNTFWLEKSDWKSFAEYEAAVDAVLGQHRMLALCSYAIDRCGAAEVADVIRNHQFALLKREGRWEIVESFDRRRMREALATERERLAANALAEARAQEALRGSEARYRLLFQNMQDGFAYCRMLYDAEGRPADFVYLDVNGSFERVTGLRDVVGKRVSDVIPGTRESHPELFEIYGRVARTGKPERFEIDFRPLGMWLDVSVYSPEPEHFVAVFEDVSARKRAEEQLRRRNDAVAGIARIFREALTCETEEDLGLVCLSVTEELTRSKFGFVGEINERTGRLDDIAISDPGWQACTIGARPRHGRRIPAGFEIRGLYGRVLREGKGFFTNDPASHPDRAGTPPGHPPIHAFLGVPLLYAGRTIGLIAVANREDGYGPEDLEVAEALAAAIVQALLRKRAEEEVREANAQLTEAARRKDEFLGMLSHELRNPLAPIRNSIYVLEHAVSSEQVRRAKAVIRRQAEHLTRLVDDLLDVTRIARGKIELKRSRVDLAVLVRRAGEDHAALMRERGIDLSVDVPREPMWVDGDPTRLAQVIGNLLSNAAKFTMRGGRVMLALEETRGAAEIHVRDTGVGMEPELLTQAFDPFVQGERTLARTDGGLGLGLSLVKGLTELHGGSVRAASAGPGQGAEFVARLPLADSGAAASASARRPARGEASRRVLVIDDNADAAESLAQLVEMFGHTAEVAYDGPSGIARARANPPDFVFCDIGLPGMSGYEVARTLRADPVLRRAQLFAVSGHAQPEDRKKAADAGFDGHIAKPADPDEIVRMLS